VEPETPMAADPLMEYLSKEQLQKVAEKTKKAMLKAAKEMDYMEAARLRDELKRIEEKIKSAEKGE
jgi:excinuclease ABC subunit B